MTQNQLSLTLLCYATLQSTGALQNIPTRQKQLKLNLKLKIFQKLISLHCYHGIVMILGHRRLLFFIFLIRKMRCCLFNWNHTHVLADSWNCFLLNVSELICLRLCHLSLPESLKVLSCILPEKPSSHWNKTRVKIEATGFQQKSQIMYFNPISVWTSDLVVLKF